MILSVVVLILCSTGTINADAMFEFALKPVYGNQREGYIEMRVNTTWGIMSEYYSKLDETTSSILCQSLQLGSTGFSTNSNVELTLTKNTTHWYYLIHCNGNETDASECVQDTPELYNWVTTLSRGWTRLHCFAFEISGVRLSDGEVPHIGRLEVLVGERWGKVCVYGLSGMGYGVSITCALLGYNGESHQSYEGIPDDKPATEAWLSGIMCYSTTNVSSCQYTIGIAGRCHTVAHIRCEPMQIVHGTTSSSGIVKAGLFGQFQMICGSSNFNEGAANVTCNLLGHHRVSRKTAVKSTPVNTEPVFNGSIQCIGTEQSLELCDIEQEQTVCEDSTVVYIECLDGPLHMVPIGNKSNEGFLVFYWNDWFVHGGSVSNTTVKTLCKLLGHRFDGSSSYEPLPVDITLESHSILSTLQCFGYETDVAQCDKSPLVILTCWRCPNDIPTTFLVLYCSECEPGYFGTHCTECNCNNRSTVPCDIHTGECTDCQTGWYGTSCEHDIDECVTTTCPNNSVCTNKPGSYECICSLGYVRTDDVCVKAKECQPGYFGIRCTECNCNNRSTAPCDIVTGECTCQTGWYGTSCGLDIDECVATTCPNNSDCTNIPGSYECICRQGYVHTDDACEKAPEKSEVKESPLIIILSSVIGGLVLLSIIAIICLCKYMMKDLKSNADNVTSNDVHRPSGEHNLSPTNKTDDDNKIDDLAIGMKSNVTDTDSTTDPYDTIKEHSDQRYVTETENYNHHYTSPLPTDDKTGYTKLQGSHVTYQHLQQRISPEHEYHGVKH